MTLASFEAIVRVLNDAGVRYLVAGGVAVNAHGLLRQTKDADIVVQFSAENIHALFAALGSIGYRPLVPITEQQFADAELRESLFREKGMVVLQFHSDQHRQTPVDVFVSVPFPFAEEYDRALIKTLGGSEPVRFVSLKTLIAMKESTGRDQDRVDVANLRLLMPANG